MERMEESVTLCAAVLWREPLGSGFTEELCTYRISITRLQVKLCVSEASTVARVSMVLRRRVLVDYAMSSCR